MIYLGRGEWPVYATKTGLRIEAVVRPVQAVQIKTMVRRTTGARCQPNCAFCPRVRLILRGFRRSRLEAAVKHSRNCTAARGAAGRAGPPGLAGWADSSGSQKPRPQGEIRINPTTTIFSMLQHSRTNPSHPRADGPGRRRAFSAADKLAHLTASEQAYQSNGGGAYLRREGLYSSLISEWRKQRDAGVVDGTKPGEKTGKPTRRTGRIRPAHTRIRTSEQEAVHHPNRTGNRGKAHASSWSNSPRAQMWTAA